MVAWVDGWFAVRPDDSDEQVVQALRSQHAVGADEEDLLAVVWQVRVSRSRPTLEQDIALAGAKIQAVTVDPGGDSLFAAVLHTAANIGLHLTYDAPEDLRAATADTMKRNRPAISPLYQGDLAYNELVDYIRQPGNPVLNNQKDVVFPALARTVSIMPMIMDEQGLLQHGPADETSTPRRLLLQDGPADETSAPRRLLLVHRHDTRGGHYLATELRPAAGEVGVDWTNPEQNGPAAWQKMPPDTASDSKPTPSPDFSRDQQTGGDLV
jgi:hypothetical protein